LTGSAVFFLSLIVCGVGNSFAMFLLLLIPASLGHTSEGANNAFSATASSIGQWQLSDLGSDMVLVHLFLFFITRKAAFLVTLRDRLYRAAFIDPVATL
jgi:hypothetical protein